MPTYEYQCKSCKQRVEAFQKVSAAALKDCPKCAGELRRVFHPVGIHFKGSGFYSTDHAKKKAAPVGSGETKSEDKGAEPKTGDKGGENAAASDKKAGPPDSGGSTGTSTGGASGAESSGTAKKDAD